MKVCTCCKKEKPEEDFHMRSSMIARQAQCAECQREKGREKYKKTYRKSEGTKIEKPDKDIFNDLAMRKW